MNLGIISYNLQSVQLMQMLFLQIDSHTKLKL